MGLPVSLVPTLSLALYSLVPSGGQINFVKWINWTCNAKRGYQMIIWVVLNIKKYKIPNMNRHVRKKIRTTYQNNGGFILLSLLGLSTITHTHTHTPHRWNTYVNFKFSQELQVYILGIMVINGFKIYY